MVVRYKYVVVYTGYSKQVIFDNVDNERNIYYITYISFIYVNQGSIC